MVRRGRSFEKPDSSIPSVRILPVREEVRGPQCTHRIFFSRLALKGAMSRYFSIYMFSVLAKRIAASGDKNAF